MAVFDWRYQESRFLYLLAETEFGDTHWNEAIRLLDESWYMLNSIPDQAWNRSIDTMYNRIDVLWVQAHALAAERNVI